MNEKELRGEIDSLKAKLEQSQQGRADDAARHAEQHRQVKERHAAELVRVRQEGFAAGELQAGAVCKQELAAKEAARASELGELRQKHEAELGELGQRLAKSGADQAAALAALTAKHDAERAALTAELSKAKADAARYQQLAEKRQAAVYAARKHVIDADAALTAAASE